MDHSIKALVRLVRESFPENGVMAEIGVFSGDTTVHYLPIVKERNGKSILVDWFYGSEANGPHRKGQMTHDELLKIFVDRIKSIDCEEITRIIDMDSSSAADKIEDESLDLCFIDADHRYEYIKKDIQSYLPKVKHGGILCGHDCEGFRLVNTFSKEDLSVDVARNCHAGVIQAVWEAFGEVELIEDWVWVYRKQ